MGTVFTSVVLPVALGMVMLGLGLSLTRADFERVLRHPRVTLVALGCQVLVLPAACFALVLAFDLPPTLAVGMMLLAAAPGGSAANVFSHLFRGDVALNISLTAVNSVLALVTLPLIVNVSAGWFGAGADHLGAQARTAVEVFVIVLLPVLVGMFIRFWRPAWADRMDRPVRRASFTILVLVMLAAIVTNWNLLTQEFGRLSVVTVLFCLLSLTVGFVAPRRFGASHPQAVATAFEIGVHNATLAIVVAQTVLGSTELSLPAAVYAVLMLPLAFGFGVLMRSRDGVRRASAV